MHRPDGLIQSPVHRCLRYSLYISCQSGLGVRLDWDACHSPTRYCQDTILRAAPCGEILATWLRALCVGGWGQLMNISV